MLVLTNNEKMLDAARACMRERKWQALNLPLNREKTETQVTSPSSSSGRKRRKKGTRRIEGG